MIFQTSGSVIASRDSVIAHAQYPSYCGAYFPGLAANRSWFSLDEKCQVMSCQWNVSESLPLTALPALKYATASYPLMARSLCGAFSAAIPLDAINRNERSEKPVRIPSNT